MLKKSFGYLGRNFAVIVSTLAFAMGAFQMIEQRNHDKVSVRPVITTYYSIDGRKEGKMNGIYFYNGGQGNAVIDKIVVTVDGKEVNDPKFGPFYAAIKDIGLNPLCFVYRTPRKNDFLKVDAETAFIEAKDSDSNNCIVSQALLAINSGYQGRPKFDFKIYFKSLYDEEFVYHYLTNSQAIGWN